METVDYYRAGVSY